MSNGSSMYIQNEIFNPNVMQGIFDVIQPEYPDSLRMQEAFFPMEEFTSDEMIAFFEHNFWGMTPPTALGSDPMNIGIPGGFYKNYNFGYWGEYSRFDNKDLLTIKDPVQPYKADGVIPNLWGEGMMLRALAMQKHRFQTFQEAFCSALIGTGNFHVFGDGIDYYFPGPSSSEVVLPPHYRLSVVAGTVVKGGWTSGGTWATAASATPTRDLNQMILYMSEKLGLQVSEIWMSRKAAQYLIDADETASWVEKNPQLSADMLTVEAGLTALNKIVGDSITFKIEDRTYPERMVIKSPTNASSSTTVTVDNDAVLGSVTTPTLTFHKRSGEERLLTATGVSANVITFTASDLDISMDRGDFIIYNKRFMAEAKIVFKTTRTDRQKFASLPVQTSPDDTFTPGVHTYSQEIVKKPNWSIDAGTYFRGGALIFNAGGWATLTVIL